MAKYNAGILGGYSGTIGSVTGYRRNGKNLIQSVSNVERTNVDNSFVTNQVYVRQWMQRVKFHYKFIARVILEFDIEFSIQSNLALKYHDNIRNSARPQDLFSLHDNNYFKQQLFNVTNSWNQPNNRYTLTRRNLLKLQMLGLYNQVTTLAWISNVANPTITVGPITTDTIVNSYLSTGSPSNTTRFICVGVRDSTGRNPDMVHMSSWCKQAYPYT